MSCTGSCLSAGFGDRQLTALSARLGLTGLGARSLAEAGVTVGMTRERVRQLERRFRDHAAASGPQLAAVRGALRRTERIVPATSSHVSEVLAGAGLVPRGFHVSGLLRIADVLGLEHDLCQFGTNVVRKRDLGPAQELLKHARRVVRRDGVGNFIRVTQELGPAGHAASVSRLLALHAEVNWLDRGRSWFLVTDTRSRAGGLLGKMLSASGPLTLGDVHDGLRRAPNPVFVPRHVVAGLCEAFPWLVVDRARKLVTLKVALDVRSTHSPLELAILRIFAEHGSTLTVRELIARGERLGLNSSSVRAYLARMPEIEWRERGLYALRGNGRAAA